jgi:hypothetical protein
VDIILQREGRELLVQVSDPAVHLASRIPGAEQRNGALHIPLPAVEAGISQHLPEFGAETHQMKVLSENFSDRSLVLQLSAPGGSTQMLIVRENTPAIRLTTKDGELGSAQGGVRPLQVRFPDGAGYKEKTVTLSW